MNFLLVIVLAVLGFFYINHSVEAPLAANRGSEQRELIIQLEQIGTEESKRLARQWRSTHPKPTESDLSELAQIVSRVKADPQTADDFTIEARRRSRALAEEVYKPVFGWGDRPNTPGLD